MARFEHRLKGDFDSILEHLHNGILDGSASASYEDGSDFAEGDVRCAVRVYERFSYTGNNRVSLNLTLVGRGEDIFLSAITAGGSQAVFFKLNTFGEEAFLDKLVEIVEQIGKSCDPQDNY